MADHSELSIERATAVNIAVASAHGALTGTEISAGDIEQRFAKS
jgi:hypothetical protein